MPEPHLRAGDTDRAAVATVLGRHMAEGRLTVAEYDELVTRAYAARTFGDLDALTADLPPIQPPAAAAPPGPATGSPGPPAHPPAAGQAAAKAALYRSLIWYGLLTAVLLAVWAMSGRDYFWPIWPILGFALFLGWQAFNLFGPQDPDRARRRGRDR